MNNIIYICLIILSLVFLFYIRQKEFFQENNSDILLLLDSNRNIKAQFNNIKKYVKVYTPKPFNAVLFNGRNSSIIIPKINYNNLTVKLFFKIFELGPEINLLDSVSGDFSIKLINKKIVLVKGNKVIQNDRLIIADKMYFLAICFNNDKYKIHINGSETEEKIDKLNNTEEIILGTNNHSENYFMGTMGNIIVENKYNTHQELCDYSESCENVFYDGSYSRVCKFMPEGETIDKCVSKCITKTNCSVEYCNKACESCQNPSRCKWVKTDDDIYDTVLYERRVPKSFNIKALPFNEKSIIQWVADEKNQGSSPVTNYIIIVEKLSDKGAIKRISVHKEPNCSNCEYEVKGLKNQEAYNIAIRAVNNEGIGPISNIETVVPVGDKRPYDISDTLLDSDKEIAEKVSKDTDYGDLSCNRASNFVGDNHILSKEYDNLYDYIEKVFPTNN